MRLRRLQWSISPETCWLSSEWTACGSQARNSQSRRDERPRGCSAQLQEVEDSINHGRTAFVTAASCLRGGMPIVVNGKVVGAVGVAGRNKETDADIAKEAAGVVGSHTVANEP